VSVISGLLTPVLDPVADATNRVPELPVKRVRSPITAGPPNRNSFVSAMTVPPRSGTLSKAYWNASSAFSSAPVMNSTPPFSAFETRYLPLDRYT